MLPKNLDNFTTHEMNTFKTSCLQMNTDSLKYFQKWTTYLNEFSIFEWMNLRNIPEWSNQFSNLFNYSLIKIKLTII